MDDASLSTGSQFTLSVTVTNAGDGASEATRLRYYRLTDSTITSSDTEQGSEADGCFSPGDSAVRNAYFACSTTSSCHSLAPVVTLRVTGHCPIAGFTMAYRSAAEDGRDNDRGRQHLTAYPALNTLLISEGYILDGFRIQPGADHVLNQSLLDSCDAVLRFHSNSARFGKK